jgi:hypothetical protein
MMDAKGSQNRLRIALMWRGDPSAPPPAVASTRFAQLFAAFADRGVEAAPVLYDESAEAAVAKTLATFDAVLVWVDPLSDGKTRVRLDPLLRQLAARGVWVSAHPDTILKMGTKEVLWRTRTLGWGGDTQLYRTRAEFEGSFPERLHAGAPRVLKQYRGNGGQGVWKVSLGARAGAPRASMVRVLHALRGSEVEEMTLDAFMARCAVYFEGEGRLIDQAFQPRLPEGMIRCYVSGGRVVGYGQQLIKALVEPQPGDGPDALVPGPRIMHPPDAAPFQRLRAFMEREWIPGLQALLELSDDELPAIWDADFLFGAKDDSGEDTYVLCEINVSSVAPYPDSAVAPIAAHVLAQLHRRHARL